MSDLDRRAPNGWPSASDPTEDWEAIEAASNEPLADGLPRMGVPYWSGLVIDGFTSFTFPHLEPWTRFDRGVLFLISYRYPLNGFEFDDAGCDPDKHGFEGVVGGVLKISNTMQEMVYGGGYRNAPVGDPKIYKVVQYDEFAGVYVLRYAD